MTPPFKVGDEVTVHTSSASAFGGIDRRICKVARVLKKSLVLDDAKGSRWTLDGRPQPRGAGYRQPCLRHTEAADRLHIERYSLLVKVTDLVRSPYDGGTKLSLDQLRRIVAIAEEGPS